MKISDDIVWQAEPLTTGAIAAIEQDWHDLLANSIEKNIYMAPWFVRASIALFPGPTPQLITIYSGNLLIGVLLVESDFGYAKMPVWFLRNTLHKHQFLGTPLVREAYVKEFASGLLQWLDASRSRHQFILFTQMTGDSDITDALNTVSAAQNRSIVEFDRFDRAKISADKNHGAQTQSHLSTSRKKGLKRRRLALTQHGEIAFEKLRDAADLEAWISDFLRLENLGWKHDKGTSIEENADDEALYRRLLPDAFDANALNFFRLTVGGKPIAYTLDFACGTYVYCHRCAFDVDYKKYAPGVLMEVETQNYYGQNSFIKHIDSCTAPDNQLLNELWPDRKSIVTIGIVKNHFSARLIFKMVRYIKGLLKNPAEARGFASK